MWLPLIGLPASFRDSASRVMTYSGIRELTSPANSMKRGGQALFAGKPREIKGIDRDAVSAQSGTGIKRLEAERLGLGRVDHLPDVDSHAVVEHLQLVDQRDVHGPVGVLEDFARLGDFEAGNRNHLHDRLAIEQLGQFQTRRVVTADHFWNCRPPSSPDCPDPPRSGL